jgi:mitogen-activated protein kinase kinase
VKRETYAKLLDHAFIVGDKTRDVDMVGWVETALARRDEARKAARSAAAAASTMAPHPPSSVSADSNGSGSTITPSVNSSPA